MKNYYYPKECFTANEAVTRVRMKEYERKVDKWYEMATSLYPNYFEMDLKERLRARRVINETIGYSL